MGDVVLDASVVLAAALGEPGGEILLNQVDPVLVSTVNLAEVRAKLVDRGYDRASTDEALGLINMTIIDFTQEHAAVSAELRAQTRAAGLSLGDRACLAVAVSRKALAVTADRAWAGLHLPVEVSLVR